MAIAEVILVGNKLLNIYNNVNIQVLHEYSININRMLFSYAITLCLQVFFYIELNSSY